MWQGCYEETASMEFRLYGGCLIPVLCQKSCHLLTFHKSMPRALKAMQVWISEAHSTTDAYFVEGLSRRDWKQLQHSAGTDWCQPIQHRVERWKQRQRREPSGRCARHAIVDKVVRDACVSCPWCRTHYAVQLCSMCSCNPDVCRCQRRWRSVILSQPFMMHLLV